MPDQDPAFTEMVEAFDDLRFTLPHESPASRPLAVTERLLWIAKTSPNQVARASALGALFCLAVMYPVDDKPASIH